ncbi:hypothetical protein CKAN_00467600 [Cinnamomum micranthum f. kanehirae]|uniref:Pentatricopeptide repeat-containing protein n=1 Tax=Cinnamomum micranthum f. kanehirae TaxID=337451 RepID=A0A3S3MM99_9MAGN|nr:hypothetical protein CKAN_00467600 [Cinnamomum micranthum f. kanehirae]
MVCARMVKLLRLRSSLKIWLIEEFLQNVKVYNMLIDGYCKMGKLLEAFKLLEEMTKKAKEKKSTASTYYFILFFASTCA